MNNETKNLVIITGSYPYDCEHEDTFLSNELKILCKSFDNVFIIPEKLSNKKAPVPDNVILLSDYALKYTDYVFNSLSLVVNSLLIKCTWHEFVKHPMIFFSYSMLSQLLNMAGNANRMRRFIGNLLSERKICPRNTIFYTYWLGSSSLAIGLLKKGNHELKLVARAHGHDLYWYRHSPEYIPLQLVNIRNLDRLFVISEDGNKYLREKYATYKHILSTSRLGVGSPGFVSMPSKDGVYRIFSCSMVVEVKRVDLIYESMRYLAETNQDNSFEWYHIGDGPLMRNLKVKAINFPANLSVTFCGFLENYDVLKFYREMPCDVFVNTSMSEGISVALMEAVSCGIPVVATAVGGNPEVVFHKNGVLLPKNPSPKEVADAILSLLIDGSVGGCKRMASLEVWDKYYKSEVNYAEFSKDLLEILQ